MASHFLGDPLAREHMGCRMRNALLGLAAIGLATGCKPAVEEDSGDTAPVAVEGCRTGPGPSERIAVVNHPYATDPATWEVFDVDAEGEITSTGTTFLLGRSTTGRVAFTPDGSIGLVALEDGVLGVFEVEDGAVRVIETDWQGTDDLYVTGVAMHPSGEKALVLDANWRKNGGQVTEVAIDCVTGEVTQTDAAWPSKLAQAAAPFGAEEWVVAADDLGTSGPGSVHRLGDDVVATAELFADASAIVSAMAVHDQLVVLGDYNAFEYGDRLGVGRISADGIEPLGVVSGVTDPVDLAFSPDGSSLLVSSGFGDALLALTVGEGAQPVELLGELTYSGGGPALPSGIVVVPDLSMAFVSENLGIRRVQFGASGAMTDLGRFDVGTGTESVVGALGVQP